MDKKVDREYGSAIVLIGDRISGKTTYLASLVRNPNSNPNSSPIQGITNLNDNSIRLLEGACNILELGDMLPPTCFRFNSLECENYNISISLKISKFRGIFKKQEELRLYILLVEYSGEFFEHLQNRESITEIHQDYIEGIALGSYSDIILTIDGINSKDDLYANSLKTLFHKLKKLIDYGNLKNIAVVFTKCDLPELYHNRNCPQDLARLRFPKTYQVLELWQIEGWGKVEYFYTSAFGILTTKSYIEPNYQSIDIPYCFGGLKDPKRWKPFGLVAPLYWLATGKRHPELDLA